MTATPQKDANGSVWGHGCKMPGEETSGPMNGETPRGKRARAPVSPRPLLRQALDCGRAQHLSALALYDLFLEHITAEQLAFSELQPTEFVRVD